MKPFLICAVFFLLLLMQLQEQVMLIDFSSMIDSINGNLDITAESRGIRDV